MKPPFSSLEYLEVPESSLYPKPGAPELRVFRHLRKRSKAWVQVPTLKSTPTIHPSTEERKTPKSKPNKNPRSEQSPEKIDNTPVEPPVKKKRGRPKKDRQLSGPKVPVRSRSRTPTHEPEVVEVGGKSSSVKPHFELVEDKVGETKLLLDGSLLSGREFAIQMFPLPSRPGRFFLSLAPLYRHLNLVGRRQMEKHFPMLPIFDTTSEDQDELFKTGILRSTRKNSRVGVVPAYEAFKIFGHLIVKQGEPGKDDYYQDPEMSPSKEFALRAVKESDDSDESTSEEEDDVSQRNFQYEADLDLPLEEDVLAEWMVKSAYSFNKQLSEFRRANAQFYDPHTNQNLYPKRTVHPDNDICKVDDTILECLPPDMRAAILQLKQNQHNAAPPSRSSLYPLALNEAQRQANIPVHSSRFGHDLQEGDIQFLSFASRPSNLAIDPGFGSPTFAKPLKPINAIRTVSSKESQERRPNGKTTCGFPRANGSGPCVVQVSHPGKLCHFHRNEAPAITGSPSEDSGEAANSGICVFCNATLAPPTALELNGGLKLQPGDGRRRKIARSETIACAECNNSCHLWCIQITDTSILERMRSYDWVCNDCKRCSTCESPEDEETLLFLRWV